MSTSPFQQSLSQNATKEEEKPREAKKDLGGQESYHSPP